MFELKYKEMFAGEIYLEMTYFINVSRHLAHAVRCHFSSIGSTGCTSDPEKGAKTNELDGLWDYRSITFRQV